MNIVVLKIDKKVTNKPYKIFIKKIDSIRSIFGVFVGPSKTYAIKKKERGKKKIR